MNTCIYLGYKGLGANLLHLAYCHEISKKFGPVTIITLCKNLEDALKDDTRIKKVYFLEKYHKKFFDTPGIKGEICMFGKCVSEGYVGNIKENNKKNIFFSFCFRMFGKFRSAFRNPCDFLRCFH